MALPALVHFREVNRTSFALVEQQRKRGILSKRIRAELSRHLDDVDLFIEKLKQSKAVVSGGFLLSMCDPSISTYDDMVILHDYGQADNTTVIDKHIYHLSRQSQSDDVIVYPKNLSHYRLPCAGILLLRAKTTLIKEQKFQVIELDPKCDIIDTIKQSFDFSVLVNTWDGSKLEINDIHGIADSQISLNNVEFDPRSRFEYRTMKYAMRGFSFKDLNRAVVTDNGYPECQRAYYKTKLESLKNTGHVIAQQFSSISCLRDPLIG
jgi:hypothetical protein